MKTINIAYALIIIAVSAILCSCSKSEDVFFTIPCGDGNLVFVDSKSETFETTYHSYELRLVGKKGKRVVDRLKKDRNIYTAPAEPEKFYRFTDELPIGRWPIIVNPNEFAEEEYSMICETLKKNIDSKGRISKWTEGFSCIRYLALEPLEHTYSTTIHGLTFEISSTGRVEMIWKKPGSIFKRLIGIVKNNGKQIVLGIKDANYTLKEIDPKLDLQAVINGTRDCKGRKISDQFEIIYEQNCPY